MPFDLDLDTAVKKIKEEKAKLVCIQLADGLKPQATKIVDYLEEKTNAKIVIWMDSCYGSCDYPILKDIDLLIQFGHSSPSDLLPNP
jgi:diphthamide biosynthesis enzyme Dph1/Dph2-like protein